VNPFSPRRWVPPTHRLSRAAPCAPARGFSSEREPSDLRIAVLALITLAVAYLTVVLLFS